MYYSKVNAFICQYCVETFEERARIVRGGLRLLLTRHQYHFLPNCKVEEGPDLSQVFMGNLDKDTERRHYLNEAFTARYIRLNPKHWHQAIALRAALLGCPHEGECGQRFFRVAPDMPCGG